MVKPTQDRLEKNKHKNDLQFIAIYTDIQKENFSVYQ